MEEKWGFNSHEVVSKADRIVEKNFLSHGVLFIPINLCQVVFLNIY